MERSTLAPNEQNKSRIGSHPSLESSGNRLSKPLEAYYIVEGENTERFYIRHLDKINKLKYSIKEFEVVECPKGSHWVIIDGIKSLKGGGYFSELNSLEELRVEIDKTINKSRPYIICVFDLDKCVEPKGNKLWETYRNDLLPLSKNDYVIFCASMPNVEYWFLSHSNNLTEYDDHLSYNTDNKDKIKDGLNSIIGGKGTFYSKRDKFFKTKHWRNLRDYLCNDENLNRAISRAKAKANHSKRLDRVDDRMKCDVSYSDMYKLFEIQ